MTRTLELREAVLRWRCGGLALVMGLQVAAAAPPAVAQQARPTDTPKLTIETPDQSSPATPSPDAGPSATTAVPPTPSAAAQGPTTATAAVSSRGEPVELFIEGNQAYEEGRYGDAIALYEQLLDGGRTRSAVYYNLGNAYLRSGDLGHAIAAFLEASALNPRDQDTEANLTFARSLRKDALAAPEPSAVARTLFFWRYAFAPHEIVRACAVASALLFGLLIALWLRPAVEPLRWGASGVAIALLALLVALGATALFPRQVAVVVPPEVEARSGNDPETVVRFLLHSGAEVRALEARAGWVRIQLPDGEQGWLPREHVELIKR